MGATDTVFQEIEPPARRQSHRDAVGWLERAGFATKEDAARAGCDERNSWQFRDGQRTEQPGANRDAEKLRTLEYEWANALPDEPEDEDQLIEGVIGRVAMSVLYGDSNSGKTFFAIDIGCAVARGLTWMQRRTVAGLVVYLATESPRSVRTRVQGYQRKHGCKVDNFLIVSSPIDLFDGSADAMAVVQKVGEIEAVTGMKCELVIGDTLARMAAGANENSGEDMGAVIAHAEIIRREAQVHFMLVHHSGKDQARGARGWSGLRAAIDTEIEVTADETTGQRAAEITKQRDLPGKGDRIGFKLEVVELGIGQWGKLRTTCAVVPTEAPAKVHKSSRVSEIGGAILELLRAHGTGMKKSDVAKHFKGRYPSSSVYRELAKLHERRRIHDTAGMVAYAPPPGIEVIGA